jgi:hypothetical protein
MTDGPTPSPMPGAPPASLVDRVKNLLLSPKTEWPRIDAEAATVSGLFTGYAMILAALGPIASVIGGVLIGASMSYLIVMAVVSYVIGLAMVFINSLIIDGFAPTFGGTKNNVQATKVAVYIGTPGWLAGILGIVPQLLPLMMLVGLAALVYGIYLLYLGLPTLMRVSQDKAVGYIVVVVAAWIIIYWVLMAVVIGLVLSTLGIGMMGAAAAANY